MRPDGIWLPFVGDRHLDALDRMLDVLTEVRGMDVPDRPKGEAILPWLDRGGLNVTWPASPDFVRAHFRQSARALIESYPRYLPDSLDVGGFTMGDAGEVLIELLAQAQHSQACLMRGSRAPNATTPVYRTDEFVHSLSIATNVDEDKVDRIVATHLMNPESPVDPCLTPIVPLGDGIVPMSSLIAPGSPLRNLTVVLQQDFERFGRAGQALGRLGVETCADTLRRVAGCKLATNVYLTTPDGRRVGDLDVVVVDPANETMAVFEVTWQIAPDGSSEIGRVVDKAVAKRQQVARNRTHIESGQVRLALPAHWPDVLGYKKRWFILTRDVLPLGPTEDDIVIRSHQVLAWMLRSDSTITDLFELLDSPPTPPEPLDILHESTIRYGDISVSWDQVIA